MPMVRQGSLSDACSRLMVRPPQNRRRVSAGLPVPGRRRLALGFKARLSPARRATQMLEILRHAAGPGDSVWA
jgi:hypothetical protein